MSRNWICSTFNVGHSDMSQPFNSNSGVKKSASNDSLISCSVLVTIMPKDCVLSFDNANEPDESAPSSKCSTPRMRAISRFNRSIARAMSGCAFVEPCSNSTFHCGV